MPKSEEKPYVKIGILENAIEAQLVSSLLDQYRIPHRIRSYHDTAYDGLFQMQKGWGELTAPVGCKQEILEVLNDIRSNQQIFPKKRLNP
jgi:hypothetical protein